MWAGQVISQVGSSMTGFALSIFVYQISGSVTQLAMVLLAANLPGIVLAPVAGVWVDRIDRRIVMMVSDTAAGLGALALLIIAWTGELTFWPMVIVAAFGSAGAAFQEPAYRASIVTLVPKEKLGRANGMIEMGPALGTLVAPAIAGAIILTLGIRVILAIDVITFLIAVGTLGLVRFPRLPSMSEENPTPMRAQITAGFRYLRQRPGLLGLLTMAAGLNFFLVFANVLWLPVFLGFANEAQVGFVMTGVGVAMVAGSVVMSAWGGPERLVGSMIGMLALGGVLLSLSGVQPSIWWAGAAVFAFMFMIPLVNGISQTLWQRKVDADIQGRVFSTRRMIASIASPLAFIIAGPLADGVFEPLLTEDGPLASTVGEIIGVGVGRGSALLLIVAGLGVTVTALIAWSVPAVRNIEVDIPDAVIETV
ncbi:MAG: MFS transporter [Acidimicrobiia bacterium]|nr:MFS transporter [Acidimicrobiia bacterium]